MTHNWIIKEFSLNDYSFDDFLDWRKLFDRRHITKEFLEWQYFSSPFGPIKTWLAVDNGKIVGQYSLQPFECYINGRKMLASLCLDVSTHPNYQKQGIFTKLGFHALVEDGKRNIAFSIGFPNAAAVPGHQKVGWTFLGKRLIYEKRNLGSYSFSDVNQYEILPLLYFNKRFDDLIYSHKHDLPIILNRNSRYLTWRYLQKVGYQYLCYEIKDIYKILVGYIILREYKTETEHKLHIIDFIIPPEENCFRQILDFVIKIALNLDIELLNIMASEKLPFMEFLKSHGFVKEDQNQLLITHQNNNQAEFDSLKNIMDFYITFGDSDVY